MSDLTERNRAHWDAAAANYNSKNEKAMDGLIAEIRDRLDWIGPPAGFLDSDSEDERDDELGEADENALEGDQRTLERKSVRLLDYACGTGMVSRALGPYVSQTIGIDLSTNMATEYNIRANAQGLSNSEMHAFVGNLLDPADPSPVHLADERFHDFDIAVVGLGFHHFDDPTLAATRLAERLKKGGVLLIIDFLPHAPDDHVTAPDGNGEGSSHRHGHGHGHGHDHGIMHEIQQHLPQGKQDMELTVPNGLDELKKSLATVQHHGFSEEDVKSAFEKAGVGKDFAYDVVARQVVFKTKEKTMKRNVFMARGTKV